MFQTLAYQINSLCLYAHWTNNNIHLKSQALKKTPSLLRCIGFVVYLRLAQESTISKPLEITSIVSLPAFDQGFVIYLSSCTVPLQTQRDDLHLIVFWAPPATKKTTT